MNSSELAEAVRNAQQGDRDAVELLYNEFSGRLTRFIKKKIGSDNAAEDILSETFVSVMEHISELKTPEAFGGWIYAVANRKCIDWLSRESQRTELSEIGDFETVPLPEDHVVDEETRRRLGIIVEELKPEQRTAVMLYYYEQKSVSEVAEAIGKSKSATKKILQRAREKIHKQIEKLNNKGSVFALMPIEVLFGSAFDDNASAAMVSAKGARVAGLGFGVKAALVGTFAAASIAVPTELKLSYGGGYRPDESSYTLRDEAEPIENTSGKKRINVVLTGWKDTNVAFEYENNEYILPISKSLLNTESFLPWIIDKGDARILMFRFIRPENAEIEVTYDMTEITDISLKDETEQICTIRLKT